MDLNHTQYVLYKIVYNGKSRKRRRIRGTGNDIELIIVVYILFRRVFFICLRNEI